MVLEIGEELATALAEEAHRRGITAESLALAALSERFQPVRMPAIQAQDEWERRLLGLAKDCGVSLKDEYLSRDALYE